jgi:hypothetical protein
MEAVCSSSVNIYLLQGVSHQPADCNDNSYSSEAWILTYKSFIKTTAHHKIKLDGSKEEGIKEKKRIIETVIHNIKFNLLRNVL